MFKRSFPVSIVALIFLLFGANSAFAQCGADGKQPCTTTTPKKTTTTKKTPTTTKPTVTKPKTTTKTQTKTVPKTTIKQGCTEADNFNNKDAPSNSTQVINGVKFEFVGIPSGSFCIGSEDATPIHRVNLTRAFSMGKYEVTQAQWQAVMGNNPSSYKSCGGNCPVENISWEDVQDFLKKLNKLGEGTYRLPTEAEWEYACRAGSTTKYSYGDGESSLENYAWYIANSGDKTHEVGTKQANDWGLYDMHGNVWELVQDWYDDYPSGTVTNPTGAGLGSDRVFRGGGYFGDAAGLRSAVRNFNSPSYRYNNLGFRVVRN